MTLSQVLIVFLTGIFHDFPIWPEREYPRILPGPGEGLFVLDGDLVTDVLIVGPGEAFNRMHRIAVRMADRIQIGFVVEAYRVDHESVSIPLSHGIAKPERI